MRLEIATHHRLIEASRDSGHLKVDVELIAPEPRYGSIWNRFADDRLRDRRGLIYGILHGFETHASSGMNVGIVGAIADGEDVVVVGL